KPDSVPRVSTTNTYYWNRITNHEGLLFFEPPIYPDVPTSPATGGLATLIHPHSPLKDATEFPHENPLRGRYLQIRCRSIKFTEDFVPAKDKKVQFNDQITTFPLQDYPSENVEVEDDEDVESVSTHRIPQQHSTQVSVGASTVDTDRNPSATTQPNEGQIYDPGHEEPLSSDQESSDSNVEPENPKGLEAISGGRQHQLLSVDSVNDTPQSFADIEASPNKHTWMDATQEEYDALVNNGTWVLTELPAGRKALACKWLW
ncbi:hypothetical protein As57867_004239, partial [Aphanomyces stellatus]